MRYMNLGGWLRQVFSARPRSPESVRREMFAAGYQGWRVTDQLVSHWADRGRRIDRADALTVPAVLRGRNMICAISTLPLQLVDAEDNVVDNPLFDQIDSNTANTVMVAMTVEDLIFESVAWWRVTEFTPLGMPAKCTRYEPRMVSLEPPLDYQQRGYLPSDLPTEGVVYMDGEPVPFDQVIRFDSPNPPLLVAGERSIRRALMLDDAADLYATNRRMRGYFRPADPTIDPDDNNGITEALDAWAVARQQRLDGYVPAALVYEQIQDPTPAEIQILAQQQRADLAIANAIGIDPEDLGINTTSRTYQNAVDRRQDRVNDVLSSYMKAITDRLSMPDVTVPGHVARFELDGYLRADPKTRAEVQQSYKDMGVIDSQDIQREEGIPRKVIREPAPAPLRPAVPATQISAIPAGAR